MVVHDSGPFCPCLSSHPHRVRAAELRKLHPTKHTSLSSHSTRKNPVLQSRLVMGAFGVALMHGAWLITSSLEVEAED